MPGIVLFGGTTEGRLIAEAFRDTGPDIHICVATQYGAGLLPESRNLHIHTGRMDSAEMEGFLREISPALCIDATHPYASEATGNIRFACEKTRIRYIRLSRELSDREGVLCFESTEKAVEFLDTTEGNILITTGSKDIGKYTKLKNFSGRCYPRILPAEESISKCLQCGFSNKNIIALSPPFSEEMNINLLKYADARWLVTKNSGKEGGFDEKYNACRILGAGFVVIGHKEESEEDSMSLDEVLKLLESEYGIAHKREIYIIGAGPGSKNLLTAEALQYINKADILIGAKRVAESCSIQNKDVFISYDSDEIYRFLEENRQYRRIAFVCSGDTGLFSAAKNIRKLSSEFVIKNIAGISSPLYFMNKLGRSWENTRFVSFHGTEGRIVPLVYHNESVCVLCGSKDTIRDICRELVSFGLDDVSVTAGERLSYADEKITRGRPSDFTDYVCDSLSLVLIENSRPFKKASFTIKDSSFIRDKVPMSKEEVRSLSVSKLCPDKDSVVYDIGAGTGSVSAEISLRCTDGVVYAIEKNRKASELIKKNSVKFHAGNIEIVEGEAPDALSGLPKPTHVFIGGSRGKLEAVIKAVREKNPHARFVINAVTLETLCEIENIIKTYEEYKDAEIIQLSVSRAQTAGNYHIMKSENPVYIVSFGG